MGIDTGGVLSPIHTADSETATTVTMAINLTVGFFFVVFIVLAPVFLSGTCLLPDPD